MSNQRSRPNTTNWLKGYKVTCEENGRYYSCSLPPGVRQEYWLNRVTWRRKGKWGNLAVFESRDAAVRFSIRLSNEHIFLCEYLPDEKHSCQLYFPENRLTKPWGRQPLGRARYTKWPDKTIRQRFVPEGTEYANAAMLLEEVTESLAEGGSK